MVTSESPRFIDTISVKPSLPLGMLEAAHQRHPKGACTIHIHHFSMVRFT
jgi:hypothetical protein